MTSRRCPPRRLARADSGSRKCGSPRCSSRHLSRCKRQSNSGRRWWIAGSRIRRSRCRRRLPRVIRAADRAVHRRRPSPPTSPGVTSVAADPCTPPRGARLRRIPRRTDQSTPACLPSARSTCPSGPGASRRKCPRSSDPPAPPKPHPLRRRGVSKTPLGPVGRRPGNWQPMPMIAMGSWFDMPRLVEGADCIFRSRGNAFHWVQARDH